jgi:hypothetical protein
MIIMPNPAENINCPEGVHWNRRFFWCINKKHQKAQAREGDLNRGTKKWKKYREGIL